FFWNSPLPGWEMPARIRQDLSRSNLLVSKGDANYRRLLGDRHWPPATALSEVVRYLPAPVLVLRVAKAEIAVGLQPGQADELDRIDPDWRIDGDWGMIQFAA
ncbi:MAG TPA: ARMT1-like domain-containing protein, partial [Anaerolineales bacterium]